MIFHVFGSLKPLEPDSYTDSYNGQLDAVDESDWDGYREMIDRLLF